jgi:trk system potassium uptake protein TrkA
LRTAGHRVAIIDDSYESSEIPGFAGDPAAVDVLEDAGVETASTVIVVTETDRRNLLIAQLVRTRFDVSRVIVFVHDPDRVSLFTNAGHETFCVTSALAQACSKSI